eukprot:m.487518 g.487518  ORF g.487518 m.487518 type:complete len:212 (-) comp21754_c0_seq12:341-976(-)
MQNCTRGTSCRLGGTLSVAVACVPRLAHCSSVSPVRCFSMGLRRGRSAYWAFNLVANFAYSRHSLIGEDVMHRVAERESALMHSVDATDGEAAKILVTQGHAAAVKFLTNFSVTTADNVVDEWVQLFAELFVTYRDGLIVSPGGAPVHPKDQPPPPNCDSPGYSNAWTARIIADTNDHYRLPTHAPCTSAAHNATVCQGHTATKIRLLNRL